MQPLVILVSGKLGSGKDWLSDSLMKIFERDYKPMKLSFADQLKVVCMTEKGLTFDECYIEKTPNSRKVLQTVGTEEYRSRDPDIWIRYLMNWIKVYHHRGYNVFIIPDCRFPNDISILSPVFRVKSIRLEAPDRNELRLRQESRGSEEVYTSIKNHYSEIALDDYNGFDCVINNTISDPILLNLETNTTNKPELANFLSAVSGIVFKS